MSSSCVRRHEAVLDFGAGDAAHFQSAEREPAAHPRQRPVLDGLTRRESTEGCAELYTHTHAHTHTLSEQHSVITHLKKKRSRCKIYVWPSGFTDPCIFFFYYLFFSFAVPS